MQFSRELHTLLKRIPLTKVKPKLLWPIFVRVCSALHRETLNVEMKFFLRAHFRFNTLIFSLVPSQLLWCLHKLRRLCISWTPLELEIIFSLCIYLKIVPNFLSALALLLGFSYLRLHWLAALILCTILRDISYNSWNIKYRNRDIAMWWTLKPAIHSSCFAFHVRWNTKRSLYTNHFSLKCCVSLMSL